MDIFEQMIRDSGADPRTVSLSHLLGLARFYANVEMAKVKLGRAEVTADEVRATARNPETVGNRELTALTIRAGESRYQWFLAGCGCYDEQFAGWRIGANIDLDKGEVTCLSMRWPTSKRQAGRPSHSEWFKKMIAKDVAFRFAAGEASSREKVVEMMTGRDRDGRPIPGVTPLVVLPNGKKSHFTIHAMLRWADENAPALIEEARQQGKIVKAGGTPDTAFMQQLLQVRGDLGNPAAVRKPRSPPSPSASRESSRIPSTSACAPKS